MRGDLDKTSLNGGKVPMGQVQFYTMLSIGKSRDKIQILNFKPEYIKVNKFALREMCRMREDVKFEWNHPVTKIHNDKLCLYNIRSWDRRIESFLKDSVFADCSIMCFIETHVKGQPLKNMNDYLEDWKEIHKLTNHGLAVCYN